MALTNRAQHQRRLVCSQ